MNEISILVVDDHLAMRKGIISILKINKRYTNIYEAKSGEEALKLIYKHIPQIVLMDISMPGKSGIDIIREVYTKYTVNDIKFMVISVSDCPENYYRAVKAGASGFLSKTLDRNELLKGVNMVLKGEKYFGKKITPQEIDDLVKEFETIRFMERDPELIFISNREMEVLGLMYRGLSNKEIGERIFIGERTVETHRGTIMKKFGVKTFAELNVYVNNSERLKKICDTNIMEVNTK